MQTQQYSEFWQKLHSDANDNKAPLRVMFEVTYQCNFKCKHCYIPLSYLKQNNEVSTKEVFSIIDQLKDQGCFYLGFTGGEPFMRSDFMDILSYAKRQGFQVIIYTNGSLLNSDKIYALADIGLNKIDITIPGFSQKVFEEITGVKDSHSKVFKAIDALYKRRVPLGFKTCILKGNEGEINKIRGVADSLGALHRLDDALSARLDGSKEPFEYRGFNPDSNTLDIDNMDCSIQQSNIEDGNINLFPCGVGKNQVAITPFGELKPCLMIDQPRFKISSDVRSLAQGWEKLKDFIDSIKVDENYQCRKCNLKAFCKWCPARGWLYNKNFTSCDPECKLFAQHSKQSAQKEKIEHA